MTSLRFEDITALDELFKQSKDKITKLVQDGVKAFVSERPTCPATDRI